MPPLPPEAAARGAGRATVRSAVAVLAVLVLVLALTPATGVVTRRAQASTSPQEHAAVRAEDFVDSIGVNIHLNYDDTPYVKFPRIREALRQLGVRHVRDGLSPAAPPSFYRKLNTLAADGVSTQLVVGSPGRRKGEQLTSVDASLALVRKHRVQGALSAIEGPNEWDMRGGKNWAKEIRAYQKELAAGIRADRSLTHVAVVGPSVARRHRRAALGDLSGSLDFGNNHTYQRSGPQRDDAANERKDAAVVSRDRPVIATESGYTNGLRDDEGKMPVSEAVAALYVPRVFADFYAAGLHRTFLYELVDERADPDKRDDEANFGLLRHDLRPKPAFFALQRLIDLASPRGVSLGQPAGRLSYSLSTRADDVRQLLLDRGDGTFTLLLWRDVDVAPLGQGQDAPDVPFTVTLAAPARETALYRPSVSAEPVEVAGANTQISGSLRADVVAITVAPALPAGATPAEAEPLPQALAEASDALPRALPTSPLTRRSPPDPEQFLAATLVAVVLVTGLTGAQLAGERRRRPGPGRHRPRRR
jgi:hypothetical protein